MAGLETLKILKRKKDTIYLDLEEKTNKIVKGIKTLAKKYKINICVNNLSSLYTIFFTDLKEVKNLEDALTCDTKKYSLYFNTMLENGILVPPSQFEAHFVSYAHNDKDIEKTLAAIDKAFKNIKDMM